MLLLLVNIIVLIKVSHVHEDTLYMTKIRFNEFMIHKSQNLKVEKLVYNNKPCQINAFALHILTLV